MPDEKNRRDLLFPLKGLPQGRLSDIDNPMDDRLITIATFHQPFEAHIVKGRLEAEGVECFVQDEAVAQMVLYAPAIGGAKLQVRESDAARAAEILDLPDFEEKDFLDVEEEDRSEDADRERPEDAEQDRPEDLEQTDSIPECPECGSGRVERKNFGFFLALLIGFWSCIPMFNLKRKWRCTLCGHRWPV